MFRTKIAVAVAVVAIALVVPGVARASDGWPWPVSGRVSLGYGQTYVDDQGRSCTHGGMDIVAAAAAEVRVCASGQVTFAGLVPAGQGARAYAVTVLTSDGLRVTYLPLRSVSVRKGESVSTGLDLGALAGSGDASSDAAHLHLSVHRGETALDPSAFLGAAGAAPAPGAPSAPAPPAGRTSSPGVPAAKAAPGRVTSQGHAPASSSQPVHAPVSAPSVAPAPAVRSLSLDEAMRRVARSGVLAKTLAPTRVSEIAATPQLRVVRMLSDLRAGRGALASWLMRLVLLAIAGACVAPVWRSIRAASAAAAPAPVAVARRGRQ